jgi:broad specificity phosphatase PhoE
MDNAANSLMTALIDAGNIDTVYRDVYLDRARTLLAPVLSLEEFHCLEQQRAALAELPATIAHALETANWSLMKELSERAQQLKRTIDDKAALLQTARSVYDVRDIRLDPFSPGLQSFTRIPTRDLATLRTRAVELLGRLERADVAWNDFYAARQRAFQARPQSLHFRKRSRMRRMLAKARQRDECCRAVAMSVFVIRHGETEWSLNGRHTGTTDIPLTDNGRRLAELLRPALSGRAFALVLVSPLQRARETCELAGVAASAIIEPDLVEWDYGKYEGLTPEQIHEQAPGWLIFRDGCPGGETPDQVGTRADRVIARANAVDGDVALFAHGHVLRVLVARWLGLPAGAGQHFLLDTGTLSVLDHYHGIPALKAWNAPLVGHVSPIAQRA